MRNSLFSGTTIGRVPRVVLIPPPLLFLVSFLVGLGLQHFVPLTVHSSSLIEAGRAIGAVLLACGVLLALSCVGMFLVVRTTIIPFVAASSLITRGPYRFTRNPMYLSLVLVYIGAAGLLAQPWPLLLLPIPVVIINTIVIPFEESRLREAFGGSFLEYCANVRRWI